MKIFSADQIRRWDQHTIYELGISSETLMEKAATACASLAMRLYPNKNFIIFCGTGNNGGDGLAIARLLHEQEQKVKIFSLAAHNNASADYMHNFRRLADHQIPVHIISGEKDFPPINQTDIVIDALFGTGLNKPLEGIAASLVHYLNKQQTTVISIDIPSGLFCDASSKGFTVMNAGLTFSFCRKAAFMMAENEIHTGKIHYLDIGLSEKFESEEPSFMHILEKDDVCGLVKERPQFGHKGTFGHGALASGSHGMMGAAILAASAFLRSGAGKLTCYVPECGYEIMQTSVPEAMCVTSGNDRLVSFSLKENYDALGVGPGIGKEAASPELLSPLFQAGIPLVLDADALNGIASYRNLLDELPPQSILTPHPGELDRLLGKTENDFSRLDLARSASVKHKVIVVLKGHHTAICTPTGEIFFNNTGNAGMAKPGMGDVLTGLLTGLLAQGQPPLQTCMLGVYLHGRAGDLAAEKHTQQAMTALHLINELEEAWKELI